MIHSVALEQDKQLSGHPLIHLFEPLSSQYPFKHELHTVGLKISLHVRQLSSHDVHLLLFKK